MIEDKRVGKIGVVESLRGEAAQKYRYRDGVPSPTHRYLLPVLEKLLVEGNFPVRRAIDVGCGNGWTANFIEQRGFEVIGIELSQEGLAFARSNYPNVQFFEGNGYDDLAAMYGQFNVVVCFEVIEHLYDPHLFVRNLYGLTSTDGFCVVSTPYHGYWKNLAISFFDGWDRHHMPLRTGEHIKFFSESTLRRLLTEAGFQVMKTERVGRAIPALAMSMIAIAKKR